VIRGMTNALPAVALSQSVGGRNEELNVEVATNSLRLCVSAVESHTHTLTHAMTTLF